MNLQMKTMESSKELGFNFLRVYIGLALVGKGYYFMTNLNELFELTASAISYGDFILSHYIVMAHLIGGACIAAGLLTRVFVLANLPILLGAVTMVHLQEGLFSATQGLEISAMVLAVLCITLYHGSGRWSLDYYITKSNFKNEFGVDFDEDNVVDLEAYIAKRQKEMAEDKDKAA